MGDIVHSDPLYVGKPQNVGYKYLPTGALGKDTYTTFLTSNATRTSMIYVGANDGMLHAFDALTGEEKFAYVPNALLGKLKDLTSPTYKSLTSTAIL
ncbi:PilC/PilY family type IV pilus protein [Chromatium okenii]|uniref:PilC/PilY family type IV pilus protein n=1 Tax=Chromatium okenii TaxID=61644 RepID=UPI00155954C7|nr:PilC/PilY family type IV pilus protein [Chromatium okenii]